jgi:hypothetical protein
MSVEMTPPPRQGNQLDPDGRSLPSEQWRPQPDVTRGASPPSSPVRHPPRPGMPSAPRPTWPAVSHAACRTSGPPGRGTPWSTPSRRAGGDTSPGRTGRGRRRPRCLLSDSSPGRRPRRTSRYGTGRRRACSGIKPARGLGRPPCGPDLGASVMVHERRDRPNLFLAMPGGLRTGGRTAPEGCGRAAGPTGLPRWVTAWSTNIWRWATAAGILQSISLHPRPGVADDRSDAHPVRHRTGRAARR